MSAASSHVRRRVSDVISMWRDGQRPDARRFIDQHPEVRSAQALVIDLAYEEFCLRQEAGEQVDTEKFVANFPTAQHALARMLDVHGVMRSRGVKIETETEWPEAGASWLDWDLIEPLGRGAFSRVFLAREPALGNREVVLKCSFAGPDEAFILGSLSHPNIVPIHSTRYDEIRGLTAISMPLLGYRTLADALNRLAGQGIAARTAALFVPKTAKPPAEADYTSAVLSLIERISNGLGVAHAAGVIHGDIKPSNVLLSFAGEPMLMDFNLSAGPGCTVERLGGTPPYMAPECLAGFWNPLRPDVECEPGPRSDLFSLGVVLLELLLGRIPCHIDLNRPESAPTESDWQALAREAATISREPKLRRVLNRCLAFDPDQRYADAGELASDIAAITSSKRRRQLWSRRLAMGAAAGAVLGASASIWIAVHEDPNSLAALLKRAKEHIRRQEFLEAISLLDRIQKLRPDANVRAWSGYCRIQAAHYESAKASLKAALQEVDCAELRNNLAYCWAKLKQTAEAEKHFAEALRMQPGLQAVFHNRANLRRDDATSRPADLSNDGWNDYKQAILIGPQNGQLCLDAAKAMAYAHLRKQAIDGDLRELIVLALAGGVAVDVFRSSRFVHERLDLDQLAIQAKDMHRPPIPRSAPLILPPSTPLPDR